MRNRSLVTLMLVLALGAAGSLSAMMVALSPTDLSAQAQVIVTGTVTGVTSQWDDSHSTIYSDVTVSVERLDKGDAANRTLTVRVPGGEVGDIGMAVEDMPTFTTGQKVTLYLNPTSDRAVFKLAAGGQGTAIGGKPYYSYSGYHRDAATCNYHVNSGLEQNWNAAIQAGANTWSTAGSTFRFSYLGTSSNGGPTYDGINIVTRGPLGNGILAQNTYWYNRTKHVLENDIVFNTLYQWSTSGAPGYYDVQNIGTHEQGHCLVLNDLYKSYQSEMTMYGYGGLGETKKRTLETGDKDGIKFIYGPGFFQTENGPICIPVPPTR